MFNHYLPYGKGILIMDKYSPFLNPESPAQTGKNYRQHSLTDLLGIELAPSRWLIRPVGDDYYKDLAFESKFDDDGIKNLHKAFIRYKEDNLEA